MGAPAVRGLGPVWGALALAACVSLEEAPMPRGAVRPGQRTLLLVYASPGPWLGEADSKVETAAKVVPGLGLAVQAAQDERDLARSKDLQQYLPPWRPEEALASLLRTELASSGHPGRLLSPAEAELSAEALGELNKAQDPLDWRRRYLEEGALSRDYSRFLSLDDALVFEVNLAWGASSDGEGNLSPCLSAVARLYRAGTMRLLWRHEDSAEDPAMAKTLYDFKTRPQDLLGSWERLIPGLAQKIAASYRTKLQPAASPSLPGDSAARPAGVPVSLSTATAR